MSASIVASAAIAEQMVAAGRVRRLPANSRLLSEGDDAHDVILVRRGRIRVSCDLAGREVVLDVVGPGGLLGELAALDGQRRSANAVALEPCEVVHVPIAVFRKLLLDDPDVAAQLFAALAQRLRGASRRQTEYGALDAVGRVCRRLVELVERYGSCADGGTRIDAPLSQSDIAAWAGLSRESVVKALQAMRRLGWVITTPTQIIVRDVPALYRRGWADAPAE